MSLYRQDWPLDNEAWNDVSWWVIKLRLFLLLLSYGIFQRSLKRKDRVWYFWHFVYYEQGEFGSWAENSVKRRGLYIHRCMVWEQYLRINNSDTYHSFLLLHDSFLKQANPKILIKRSILYKILLYETGRTRWRLQYLQERINALGKDKETGVV